MALLADLENLKRSILEGNPAPDPAPTEWPLADIKEMPDVFQHRQLEGGVAKAKSRLHAEELAKAIQRGGEQGQKLEPVTVLWDGQGFVCVDGHHRLRAYRLARWRKPIPIRIFTGTAEKAMALAAWGNARDKLPMERHEKTNAAWRLVVATTLSKPEIIKAAGVSDGTVGEMRRTQRKLLGNGETADTLSDMSWGAARRAAAQEEHDEDSDWDARTEQEAEKLAARLLKTFGKLSHSRLPAFVLALERFDRRLPVACVDEWHEHVSPTMTEEGEEVESDF